MARERTGGSRPPRRRGMGRRKVCRFCADKTMLIDYKDSRTLGTFLTRAWQDHPGAHHRHLRPPSAAPHGRHQARPHGGAVAVHQRLSLRRGITWPSRSSSATTCPTWASIGEVVRVKPGFARNYLLPRGLAIEANSKNLRVLEHQRRVIGAKADRDHKTAADARRSRSRVSSCVCRRVPAKRAVSSARSPTSTSSACWRRAESSVDRRRIELEEPIKQLGTYPVVVQVGRDVRATIQVVVEAGEAGVRRSPAGRRWRSSRQALEAREAAALAPYAMRSRASRGRRHPEPEHPFRMAFQRDRDRIIHSTAFRRLEYKTQVFVNHEGDYYRTRLTHTMEAAQITRTLARTLGLNEDLAEAVALGARPRAHPVRPRRASARSTGSCSRTAASSTTRRACASSTCSRSATRASAV